MRWSQRVVEGCKQVSDHVPFEIPLLMYISIYSACTWGDVYSRRLMRDKNPLPVAEGGWACLNTGP